MFKPLRIQRARDLADTWHRRFPASNLSCHPDLLSSSTSIPLYLHVLLLDVYQTSHILLSGPYVHNEPLPALIRGLVVLLRPNLCRHTHLLPSPLPPRQTISKSADIHPIYTKLHIHIFQASPKVTSPRRRCYVVSSSSYGPIYVAPLITYYPHTKRSITPRIPTQCLRKFIHTILKPLRM